MSEIEIDSPSPTKDEPRFIRFIYEQFLRIRNILSPGEGVSGTFTTVDSKTVTVTDGIITDIS